MPKIDQIVRTENGETYRLAEQLSGGAMAAVWRGVAEKAGIAEQVAIKIADPAMRQQFDVEYDVLNHMLKIGAETWPGETRSPLIPSFIHKATLEPKGQAALVTELIQADTLTKLVLDESDLARRQELLVEPAYQYAWFLDFIHNRVGISQSDRTLGDLYWDAEQRRLIVLGWGVVEKGTDRAPEDVYKFGEMWYALLLGVTPAMMLGITTSREWDQLSVAWRSVLEVCLRPARQARPTAERLSTMMAQRRDAYLHTAEQLYQMGQQTLEQVEKDFWQSERAWWLLDLAWQKGLEDAYQFCQEAENLFRGRGQRLLEEASFNLEIGQFSAAKAALNEAESETDSSPGFQLRVARWRCLVDAAKTGLEEGIAVQFRDGVHHLIAAVEALKVGQWRKVTKEMEPALDSLPENSKTRVMLQSLERESELYQVLTEATVLRGNGKFIEAAEKYQAARDLLSEIVYQNAVELTIADLAYEKIECERLAETEGKLRDAQVQLVHLVNDGLYGEAKSLYDRVLLLTRGKVEARQALDAVFEPVQELEALSQARQRLGVPAEELERQAQYLLNRFPGNTAVQREAGRVFKTLLLVFEQHAREARFIEDINTALELKPILQRLGESARVEDDILERCNQAAAKLEDKRAVRQQAIELYKGDRPSQTRAIRMARQAGVELFRDELCSVARIARILGECESLQQKYKRLQREHKKQRAAWEQSQSVRQETDPVQVEEMDMSQSMQTGSTPRGKIDVRWLVIPVIVVVAIAFGLITSYESRLQNQAAAAETNLADQLAAQAATAQVNVTHQAAIAEADTSQQLATQAAQAETDAAIRITESIRTRDAELYATATFAPMATETAVVRATETAVAQATATAVQATTTAAAQATATAAYQATATQTAWDMGPGRAISLTGESPQRGQISPVGDADWFKFAISEQSTVVIETSGTQGDTRMRLYDSDLGEIEIDDDGGSERFSQIDRMCGTDSLPTGIYYVKITNYGDDDEIAGYNITLTAIACR